MHYGTMSTEAELAESLLQVGHQAKFKIYRDLLEKVRSGQPLTATELKTLHRLEKELEAVAGAGGKDAELIDNYEEAAAYCGFSKRTLSYHLKRGNLTQNTDGTFDRSELDRFLSSKGRKKSTGDDMARADLRYRLARAKREELLVKEMEGRLISADKVEEQFTARAYEFARALMLLPRRISSQLAIKAKKPLQEVSDIIEAEARLILERYSRPLPIGGKDVKEIKVAKENGPAGN
jgi:DNA-binding transcriptional ArsR family regulator